MKKTITFAYHRKHYITEVSRSSTGYPVVYTAFFWDDALRSQFYKLTFYQETSTSDILPSQSKSEDESELKAIILEKIKHKKASFEKDIIETNLL